MRALPIVYACSGCSSAGALADHVARTLDREGLAEMASIAGIGAHDPQQLSRARSRFPIVAIDGCVHACARRCLERQGIPVAQSYVLSAYGVAKRSGALFTAEEAERVLAAVCAEFE
jgi:uncharacterized metal-binding protein